MLILGAHFFIKLKAQEHKGDKLIQWINSIIWKWNVFLLSGYRRALFQTLNMVKISDVSHHVNSESTTDSLLYQFHFSLILYANQFSIWRMQASIPGLLLRTPPTWLSDLRLYFIRQSETVYIQKILEKKSPPYNKHSLLWIPPKHEVL